jgi:hypothetical protein
MSPYRQWIAALLIALVVAACGGADTSLPVPQRAALAPPTLALEPAPLFAWAAESYPSLFAGASVDGTASVAGYGTFTYRVWGGSGNYIGLLDGNVYLYGPFTGYGIRNMGPLAGFTCAVYDCASGTSNGAVAAQPDYVPTVVNSSIPTPLVVPQPSQRSAAENKSWFYRYGYPRGWAVADINGDGLDDVVAAPSFFDQLPSLPIEIWINNGDGTFTNRTADWVEGPITVTGYPTSMQVADFNGDGRPDIFISDSGQELWDCTTTPCPGATNHLLLSDATGKLHDASAGLANNQSPRFNHVVSAVADLDGDGRPDIAVPNLGEASRLGDGVVLHLNRGDGSFVDATAALSDEVAYLPFSYQYSGDRPATYNRQNVGATAILEMDGQPALVTCSYTLGDRYTKHKTVRISRWNRATSRLDEVTRFELAPALAQVAGATVDFLGNDDGTLGCAGIAAADIDHDGVTDVVVLWERWGDTYLQVMRGKGNLQYEDVTISAVGDYRATFASGGYTRSVLGIAFRDVNGDGFPDIVLRASGVDAGLLAQGVPSVLINDGSGRFMKQSLRINGAAVGTSDVAALMGCDWCDYMVLFGRFFPRIDGRNTLDLLLVSTNEDRYTDPVEEKSVSLRALKAR